MYTSVSVPFVTVIVTVFSPADHVALAPLVTVVVPFLISTVASSSSGVAVILFVAADVVTVYAVVSASKVGVSVSAPIVSPERRALRGLLPR